MLTNTRLILTWNVAIISSSSEITFDFSPLTLWHYVFQILPVLKEEPEAPIFHLFCAVGHTVTGPGLS